MNQAIKDALWFALGVVFLVTLIPPALIILATAVIVGPIERDN